MASSPKVSVLTPTYNRPAYLADAIRSVRRQEFDDWEMFVINDGGVDVGDVVRRFADPRITYVPLGENHGKAACLNMALQRARGEYVAYLDDDDLWYPDHLSTLVGALDDNPHVGVAYSDLYAVAFLRAPDGTRIPLQKQVMLCRDYNRLLMFHYNHTLHVSLMHRRDLVLRVGGYDESIRVLIDWDITRKLSFFTDFLRVPKVTGEYYQPVGLSDRISDVQRSDEESYRHNMRRVRADLPPEPWPLVERVAVVVPVAHWDDAGLRTARHLIDTLDYPCRIVLVNTDADRCEAECRQALRSRGELANVQVVCPGPLDDAYAAYLAGVRHVDADCYYLPSDDLCTETSLRLIRAVSYMIQERCAAVRWPEDPEGTYDVLLAREALFADGGPVTPDRWPQARVHPPGWLPEGLKTDYMLSLAKDCIQEGDYRSAQDFLERARAVEEGGTGDPYLVHLYAEVAFALGDYTTAEQRTRQVIAQGYGADNHVRLGLILQGKGLHEEALEEYAQGLADIGLTDEHVSSDAFPSTTDTDPDAFSAMVGRGECLLALGREEEAARALRMAARLRANSPRPYAAFGRLFLEHEQFDQAQEAFGLAARQVRPPDDVSVEVGMAELLERKGDCEAAYGWAERALLKRPDDVGLVDMICSLAARLGRIEEQADRWRQLLHYRPGNVPALRGLAQACRRMGRDEEADRLQARAAALSAGSDAPAAPLAEAG